MITTVTQHYFILPSYANIAKHYNIVSSPFTRYIIMYVKVVAEDLICHVPFCIDCTIIVRDRIPTHKSQGLHITACIGKSKTLLWISSIYSNVFRPVICRIWEIMTLINPLYPKYVGQNIHSTLGKQTMDTVTTYIFNWSNL